MHKYVFRDKHVKYLYSLYNEKVNYIVHKYVFLNKHAEYFVTKIWNFQCRFSLWFRTKHVYALSPSVDIQPQIVNLITCILWFVKQ